MGVYENNFVPIFRIRYYFNSGVKNKFFAELN